MLTLSALLFCEVV